MRLQTRPLSLLLVSLRFRKHNRLTETPPTFRTMSTQDKKALRRTIKSRLSSLTPSEISTQSTTAQHLILNLPQYKAAQRISIYLSMPVHEAQTDLLVRNALSSRKEVFVPYLTTSPRKGSVNTTRGGKAMEMLRLGDVREYEGLGKDRWGIPSLGEQSLEGRENAMGGRGPGREGEGGGEKGLDLVVVPGVAFDEMMGRVGHGAGFYDKFLTDYFLDRKKPFLGKFHYLKLSSFLCGEKFWLTGVACSRIVSRRATAGNRPRGAQGRIVGLDIRRHRGGRR